MRARRCPAGGARVRISSRMVGRTLALRESSRKGAHRRRGNERVEARGIRRCEKRQRSALCGGAREAESCGALPNGPYGRAGQEDAETPGVVRAKMGDKAPNRPPKMRKPVVPEAALSRQKRCGGITSRDALLHQIWNRPDESKGRVRCGALTRRVAIDSLVDATQAMQRRRCR